MLLRAALLGPDEAAAAWAGWREHETLEATDGGSGRLFPLVYRNLSSAAVAAEDWSKLRSAYRAAWFRNQVLCRDAGEVLALLHGAGIETMALKGIALAVGAYGDVGVRPMDDVDVLVRPADADRALAALAEAGWIAEQTTGVGFKTLHARHLHDAAGRALDLHRYALEQVSSDEPFWDASVELEVGGVKTRTLSPPDQLLHVVAHGGRWNVVPPLRWIADAELIRRTADGDLDWDRFVAEARRRRLAARLVPALDRLVAAIGFTVPDEVAAELRRARTTPLERWAQRAATKPVGGGNWLPLVLDDYARRSRLDPSLRLGDYAREFFAAGNRRQLAGRVARKAAAVVAGQASVRLAPGRVRRCAGCGCVVVALRRRSTLCARCAAAHRGAA
jgi:hypothetical protein